MFVGRRRHPEPWSVKTEESLAHAAVDARASCQADVPGPAGLPDIPGGGPDVVAAIGERRRPADVAGAAGLSHLAAASAQAAASHAQPLTRRAAAAIGDTRADVSIAAAAVV